MGLENSFDFIVVGAGIAGTSLAYELSKTSRVCIIEAESHVGYHATGRSAALFVPTYGGATIRAATRASREFLDHPAAGFCEAPLLTPRGVLYIAHADPTAAMHDTVGQTPVSGGSVETVTIDAALALVPLLRPARLAWAAYDSNAMDIDVAALHQGFLRGARAAGAVLVSNTRIEHIVRRNGNWQIALADCVATAPVLINAAGAWADSIAALCGARPVGLQPLRRTAIIVDAPRGIDIRRWPAVIDAAESFYFKPDAGLLLLSPADETPAEPGDAQPQELDIAIAVHRVEAVLDLDVRRIRRSWAGLRTFAHDRTPVVGFDPEVEGFFWCAGQGGYGIQTAPALARTAASMLTGDPLPQDIAAEGLSASDLSPKRFSGMRAPLKHATASVPSTCTVNCCST